MQSWSAWIICFLLGALPLQAVEPAKSTSQNRTQIEDIESLRVFEEPLVPSDAIPTAEENEALALALKSYAGRSVAEDTGALNAFLAQHPNSSWSSALHLNLGVDAYNTARYSMALQHWSLAWATGKEAISSKPKAVADRAAGELAQMYSRLGRKEELAKLLGSVEGRIWTGSATEKITGAREALWMMNHRPDISFRCGPLALGEIRRELGQSDEKDGLLFEATSTPRGISLDAVERLSVAMGMKFQMAFREAVGEFQVPSVIHWKVGHYAAMVRKDGDFYLIKDPTFGNSVWASRATLESEASGYFLIPPGAVPSGWRKVEAQEGAGVWGKGVTSSSEPGNTTPTDDMVGGGRCVGMAVRGVHIMLVSLNLTDQPVGYSPPVGPDIRIFVRYNHREAFQPAVFRYSNFGSKWTCDWISYLTDNPQRVGADMQYYSRGGGTRHFTDFNSGTQTYSYQPFDQSLLRRTSSSSYEMVWRDGTRMIFGKSDGSSGTTRKIFLTQYIDPAGNAAVINYDGQLRITEIRDALGQTTTFAYEHPSDIFKITRITDPFGRSASFAYDFTNRLVKITDVAGMSSEFVYESTGDFVTALKTPYGITGFTKGETNTIRWLETQYPDGSRDRVEFNQTTNLQPFSVPAAEIPKGMNVFNRYLHGRNTYYWSRNAYALAQGDYSKARVFHWLHSANGASTSGVLESEKQALEGRVWYSYEGQVSPYLSVGKNNRPMQIGRILDDGSTQLHQLAYDGFGHVTNSIDPLGRAFRFFYSSNGIDLLEVRQVRKGSNELMGRFTYDDNHRLLSSTDAAGQTTSNTYNARGQILTSTNPKGQTITFTYNDQGYCTRIDGPLPGLGDATVFTYDAAGRIRTTTSEGALTLTYDHDVLDRLTRVTFPDNTYIQRTYNRLDLAEIRGRDGKVTRTEHDALRQRIKSVDPLNRTQFYQWCSCGHLSALIDPMGHTTRWIRDVQGRLVAKQFADGSQITYNYERTRSRLLSMVDERQQQTRFTYYGDDTLQAILHGNSQIPTPEVRYTYDPDYLRVATMQDGLGTTRYSYHPITDPPSPGAGRLATEDGPLDNDTLEYSYDALGRRQSVSFADSIISHEYDPAQRVSRESNPLGVFTYQYQGDSQRIQTMTFPNGITAQWTYGPAAADYSIQQIESKIGTQPLADFTYEYESASRQIRSWTQQWGNEAPVVHRFQYDSANQLLSDTVTTTLGAVANYDYTYDSAGNRLTERINTTTRESAYNALNQIRSRNSPGIERTNRWDAENRLTTTLRGKEQVDLAYDGHGKLASIVKMVDGVQVSRRLFVWCGNELCEERNGSGTVTKRFYPQGVHILSGPNAGRYNYIRDHLGSVRGLVDERGTLRAHYQYDPYGRRTRVAGELDSDIGYAGMFWCSEASIGITRFRAYDPELGRWLSRDPLAHAELREGPNLYAYVRNEPIHHIDPLGLCTDTLQCTCARQPALCAAIAGTASQARDTIRGIGAVSAEVESGIACVGEALPELEVALPSFETQIANAITRWPEAQRQMAEYLGTLESEVPISDNVRVFKDIVFFAPPNFVIQLEEDLEALAQALAANMGVSTEQAKLYLSQVFGLIW